MITTRPRLSAIVFVLALAFLVGSSAGESRLDRDAEATLTAAIEGIDREEVAAQHALIVFQNGEVLLEHYWPGTDEIMSRPTGRRVFGPEELHDIRSCSKSVVGLLVGIAIHEGLLPGADTPAFELFPDLVEQEPELFTPAHRQITLRHLLDMTDGFAWDQDNAKPMPARNEYWLWQAADADRYVWSRPVARPAGEAFNYNSGATTLLAGVIERRAGKDIGQYANDKLFGPLGITRWEWARQRDGRPAAFGGLRLRPRDMLKLGQLVLQDGRWEDRQLVPRAWVDATADRHEGDARFYGYQWWLDRYEVDGQTIRAVAAGGLGGQYIHVFPTLDAVVVSTAGHYRDDDAASHGFLILEKWVLPALRTDAAAAP